MLRVVLSREIRERAQGMWLSVSRTTLSASASEEGYLRVRSEPRREGVRLEGAIHCRTGVRGGGMKKKGRNSIKCFFDFLSTIGE
jgi:hypothetical protein